MISAFSEELARSGSKIEGVLRQVISEDTSAVIDSILLDAHAADFRRPAGLLHSLVAIPASTATPASEAMREDLQALLSAISPASQPMFLMNDVQALTLGLSGAILDNSIVAPSVPVDTVIAIDAESLAIAADNAPSFDVSDKVTIHAAPPASPLTESGAIATPIRSMCKLERLACFGRCHGYCGARMPWPLPRGELVMSLDKPILTRRDMLVIESITSAAAELIAKREKALTARIDALEARLAALEQKSAAPHLRAMGQQ